MLDTTVLVYAVGSEHPLQRSCRRLLKAVADAAVEATTTPEVMSEFVHVRARRGSRSDAVRLGVEWMHLLTPLAVATEATLGSGLSLYEFRSGSAASMPCWPQRQWPPVICEALDRGRPATDDRRRQAASTLLAADSDACPARSRTAERRARPGCAVEPVDPLDTTVLVGRGVRKRQQLHTKARILSSSARTTA
ncbi:MAG: type II toxin-antitoxin system VapC family toxin [Nocardioidaceae bacterium]